MSAIGGERMRELAFAVGCVVLLCASTLAALWGGTLDGPDGALLGATRGLESLHSGLTWLASAAFLGRQAYKAAAVHARKGAA